jgi:hypothetical protein
MPRYINLLGISVNQNKRNILNGGLTNPIHLVSTLTSSASTRNFNSPAIFANTTNLSPRALYRSDTALRTSLGVGNKICTSSSGKTGSFNVATNATDNTRAGI